MKNIIFEMIIVLWWIAIYIPNVVEFFLES